MPQPQQPVSLSPQAAKIHFELKSLIQQKIADNDGYIDFQQFMQMALYQPSLGYYQNSLHKFGEQGDFVTAPEMGNLFAKGLANAIFSLDKSESKKLLELGAGSGALAIELLIALDDLNRLPEQYFILEPSASLQGFQKKQIEQKVPHLTSKVSWLSELPSNFEGIVFGNEVVDAIPFQVIKKIQNTWLKQNIGFNPSSDEFIWIDGKEINDSAFLSAVEHLKTSQEGYQTEYRPLQKGWVKSVLQSIKKGHLLLIDYGYPQAEYYHPQRINGSLRCFSRHLSHSQPLALAGLQDITAHVDFTELAKAMVNSGFNIDGFTTQAGFLLENKVLEHAISSNQNEQIKLSQQMQKLTAPGQMGEVMKVIVCSKNSKSPMSGFSLQDQLHRL